MLTSNYRARRAYRKVTSAMSPQALPSDLRLRLQRIPQEAGPSPRTLPKALSLLLDRIRKVRPRLSPFLGSPALSFALTLLLVVGMAGFSDRHPVFRLTVPLRAAERQAVVALENGSRSLSAWINAMTQQLDRTRSGALALRNHLNTGIAILGSPSRFTEPSNE